MTVEIAGQRYPIRSDLEERYVTELAAYVDRKMRAASDAAAEDEGVGSKLCAAECRKGRGRQSEGDRKSVV